MLGFAGEEENCSRLPPRGSGPTGIVAWQIAIPVQASRAATSSRFGGSATAGGRASPSRKRGSGRLAVRISVSAGHVQALSTRSAAPAGAGRVFCPAEQRGQRNPAVNAQQRTHTATGEPSSKSSGWVLMAQAGEEAADEQCSQRVAAGEERCGQGGKCRQE